MHSRAKVKKPKVKVQGPKANPKQQQNQQQALHVKEQEPLINGVKKSISNQPLQPQTSPNNHQAKDQCIEGKKLVRMLFVIMYIVCMYVV